MKKMMGTRLASGALLGLVVALATGGARACTITNELAPFFVMGATRDSNGWPTVTWPSCGDHVYQVFSTEQLSFTTVWTVRAALVGQDGSTSWTDTNAPAYTQRFYRVSRATRDSDSDADGIPDGWELDNSLNPLEAADACLPSSLPWANGTNNLAAYQMSLIPPTITATVTPAPNANGWNNTGSVTVSFTATDTVSGLAWVSPSSPVTITGETKGGVQLSTLWRNLVSQAGTYIGYYNSVNWLNVWWNEQAINPGNIP